VLLNSAETLCARISRARAVVTAEWERGIAAASNRTASTPKATATIVISSIVPSTTGSAEVPAPIASTPGSVGCRAPIGQAASTTWTWEIARRRTIKSADCAARSRGSS
jgi:hypothetical protein